MNLDHWHNTYAEGQLTAHLIHLALSIGPVAASVNYTVGACRRARVNPCDVEMMREAADRLEAAAALLRSSACAHIREGDAA